MANGSVPTEKDRADVKLTPGQDQREDDRADAKDKEICATFAKDMDTINILVRLRAQGL